MKYILAILIAFAAVGILNTQDINACMERGNTFEICNHIFNR